MTGADAMRYLEAVTPAALDALLAEWRQGRPDMGIYAMLPEAEQSQVAILQAACARAGVPLLGAIFPALLAGDGFVTRGGWLLRFDRMPFHLLRDGLPHDAKQAAPCMREVSAELVAHLADVPECTLFVVFDAMQPNIGTLLDELYLNLANRVHYAGVNAGSETFQPMPCLFDGERTIGGGALFMLLPGHPGAVLEHGYRAPERTVYATATEGNRIVQIDWRPAFEVYQELVREQYGVEMKRDNFYELAVHFPFGIVRANHHVVVRIPVALQDDGSLFCVGEVPANSLLTLLERPEVDTQETLRVLEQGLHSTAPAHGAGELLLFYCAGRRMHLGLAQATAELQALQQRLPQTHIAGALSLGEIGSSSVHGYPLFHNATLVAMHWQA